jgi:hypothetical protein
MNRTATVIRAALVGLLFLPLVSFAGLKEDMIALDRAYIPAFSVTGQGTIEESQRAMALLNKQWTDFKQKHAASLPNDKQWPSDLAKIDGLIAQANKVVASGKDLGKARTALEGFRFTMTEVRVRAGMPYFLDALLQFHGPMEAIVRSAKDKTPATLTDADVAQIRSALPDAEKRWGVIAKTRIDAEYGFSEAQRENLAKLIAEETVALETLKSTLAGNDKAAVLKATLAIRPGFGKVQRLFGNFESLRP